MFGWLKQYMPRGLYGRAAMILIVPIFSLQLVVSVVFIQRHFNRITEQMTRAVVVELDYLLRQVNEAESQSAALAAISPLIEPLALDVDLPAAPVSRQIRLTDFTGPLVARRLNEGVEGLIGVDLVQNPALVVLAFETRHGVMQVVFSRQRVSATNPHQLLVLMLVTGLLMTLIAYLFLRNQLKPIRRLARAAEAFGKGRKLPYKLAGATEVRSAGKAFLDMRARIDRQIEQRTLMLSGISHDLRTPLTRMKLSLSMMEGAESDELEKDVAEMERLVDTFLSFARSDALDAPAETSNLHRVVEDLVERAGRAGLVTKIETLDEVPTMKLRRAAIDRALDNLVSNANRYGTWARISVLVGRGDVRIVVEDDGPGIPADARGEALKPFARLDLSRNQNRGSGVGLGLAIANDIARGHGGQLRLGESASLGGLQIELVLPR